MKKSRLDTVTSDLKKASSSASVARQIYRAPGPFKQT